MGNLCSFCSMKLDCLRENNVLNEKDTETWKNSQLRDQTWFSCGSICLLNYPRRESLSCGICFFIIKWENAPMIPISPSEKIKVRGFLSIPTCLLQNHSNLYQSLPSLVQGHPNLYHSLPSRLKSQAIQRTLPILWNKHQPHAAGARCRHGSQQIPATVALTSIVAV